MNAFMGRDVTFGADADEVVFLGNAQQLPVVGADPYLNRLLIRFCEETRSHRAVGSTFGIEVENAIAPLLPHGKARAPEIARRLGMSPRTLQRRLAAEGLTFSTVLDGLRADLARRSCGMWACPFPKSRGCSATGNLVRSPTPTNAGPAGRREKHARPKKDRPRLLYSIGRDHRDHISAAIINESFETSTRGRAHARHGILQERCM
jgi:AraC-like DNA-binding protein